MIKMIVCEEIFDHRCSIGPNCSFESAQDNVCSNGHEKGKEYPSILYAEATESSAGDKVVRFRVVCQSYPDGRCSIGPGCRFEVKNTICTNGHQIGKFY